MKTARTLKIVGKAGRRLFLPLWEWRTLLRQEGKKTKDSKEEPKHPSFCISFPFSCTDEEREENERESAER